MNKILLSLILLPILGHAGYCESKAQIYVMTAFWKVDNVTKEIALDRVKGLEVLYTDLDTGKTQTKDFKEIVEEIYRNNDYKAKDQVISEYTSQMTYDYATILATCLAENVEESR